MSWGSFQEQESFKDTYVVGRSPGQLPYPSKLFPSSRVVIGDPEERGSLVTHVSPQCLHEGTQILTDVLIQDSFMKALGISHEPRASHESQESCDLPPTPSMRKY